MPRSKSGNPLWEPVAFKLPSDMMAELRRFADLNRMNISDVLREGMVLRLRQDGPQQEYNSYTLAEDESEDALDLATLPSLAWGDRRQLPSCPAVYFVFDAEARLLYVGKSLSLAARWHAHRRTAELQAAGATRIAWLALDPLVLSMVEALLIEHLSPLINRPLGRQKTKEYETIMARVPIEMAERAQEYARRHQLTISDVIRQALLKIVSGEATDESIKTTQEPQKYNSNTEYNGNILPTATAPEPQGELSEPAQQPEGCPAFDPGKYCLGKLCPRGHEHGNTGQSLLKISNRHCPTCDREKWHEKGSPRRQTKRQTQPA